MICHQCGACCVEISISSALPGLPKGKPAGVRCLHLSPENRCQLFGKPERPTVCSSFPAMLDICGSTHTEAVQRIRWFEKNTQPSK